MHLSSTATIGAVELAIVTVTLWSTGAAGAAALVEVLIGALDVAAVEETTSWDVMVEVAVGAVLTLEVAMVSVVDATGVVIVGVVEVEMAVVSVVVAVSAATMVAVPPMNAAMAKIDAATGIEAFIPAVYQLLPPKRNVIPCRLSRPLQQDLTDGHRHA